MEWLVEWLAILLNLPKLAVCMMFALGSLPRIWVLIWTMRN